MLRSSLAMTLLFASSLSVQAAVIDIDNAELARLTAAGVAVVDIRTEAEWKESGVVPGSHLLTFFDENGRVDPPAWLNRVKAVARPDQPVILICRSGNRTRHASQFLATQGGYATVYNVRRGIRPWIAEGRSVVPAATVMANCGAGSRC